MATIAITAAVLSSRIVGRNWLVSATNFHLRVGRSPRPPPSTSRGRAPRPYRSRCALSDVGFCGRGHGVSVPHSDYYLERQPGRPLDAGVPTRLSGWHDSPLRFGSCGFIWRYLGQYPCTSPRPRNDLAIFWSPRSSLWNLQFRLIVRCTLSTIHFPVSFFTLASRVLRNAN